MLVLATTMAEKFTPEDIELTPFEELLDLGNVTEADLWDAVNDWLENFTPAEFKGLIDAEVKQ